MDAHSPPGNGPATPKTTLIGQERSLVEAELVSSVDWLIRLRWIAGGGVILATWLAGELFPLTFPATPLYAIGAGILAYNLAFYLIEKGLSADTAPTSRYSRMAKWQVGLDWLAMALLIHFSGGIESPVLLFFIFHIIIASIFFTPRMAFAFAFLAITLVSAIALLEFSGVIPHVTIGGFLERPLYDNGLYVGTVLVFFASTGLISSYLATSIHERLRRREQEVVNLTRRLQRATSRLEALNDGARTVSSTLELKQVLNRLVKSTAEAMGLRACSIRLIDKTGRRLEPVAVYGLSQAYLQKGPVDAVINPLAREVLSGKVVNIPEVPDSHLLQYPEEARKEGIRSMLSAPLIGKDGPLGILRAYAVEPNRFNTEDEEFLLTIAAQGSIAIENALAFQAVAELDATKSNFIRIVTHELRSPVSVTQSLLRTMTAGYAGAITAPQKDILQRATRRVEFLQKLIDDLLDLAAGKTDIRDYEEMESVSLLICVERVVKRFELSAREKNLELVMRSNCPNRYPVVMATSDGLDRILDNLISNAIKYTPPQGKVEVRVMCMEDEVQILVEDNGIGIPPDSLEHVFEEFYRAPNAKELEHEGTGLGLTIVKDIVTRFGGRVAVDSTPGSGSRFTVTLPLVVEEEDEAVTASRIKTGP
jgi:signal transduction histidine kinase